MNEVFSEYDFSKATGTRNPYVDRLEKLEFETALTEEEIEENFQEELKNGELCIHMAHSSMNAKEVAEWKEQIIEAFPELPLHADMLTLSLSCHIGPGGLGGRMTAFAVNIETYPTHIAGLPVAVNICCHVNRHSHRYI